MISNSCRLFEQHALCDAAGGCDCDCHVTVEVSPGRTHGMLATYRAGCRCRPCIDRSNEDVRRRRAARREAKR